MQARRPRQRRAESAGFTLVELMTVVAIVAILALVSVILVRKHFESAKVTRAVLGLQVIRVAEEAVRAQSGEYLDCSTDSGSLYPTMNPPDSTTWAWRQELHGDWPCWRQLGLPRDGGTQYGFLAHAGRPGTVTADYPTLLIATPVAFPDPAQDLWYLIQVRGNVNGKGLNGLISSFSGEVHLENDDGTPL